MFQDCGPGVAHALVVEAPVHRTFVSVQEVDHAGMLLVYGNMVVTQVSQTFFFSQLGHSPLESESGGAPSPGACGSPSAARAARGNSRKVAIVEAFMVALSVRSISVFICIWKRVNVFILCMTACSCSWRKFS